jgi:hypothetical protein
VCCVAKCKKTNGCSTEWCGSAMTVLRTRASTLSRERHRTRVSPFASSPSRMALSVRRMCVRVACIRTNDWAAARSMSMSPSSSPSSRSATRDCTAGTACVAAGRDSTAFAGVRPPDADTAACAFVLVRRARPRPVLFVLPRLLFLDARVICRRGVLRGVERTMLKLLLFVANNSCV